MPSFLYHPVHRALTTAAAVLAAFFVAGAVRAQASNQVYCGARDSVLLACTSATGPRGFTCVVQLGEHWQRVEGQTPKQGS